MKSFAIKVLEATLALVLCLALTALFALQLLGLCLFASLYLLASHAMTGNMLMTVMACSLALSSLATYLEMRIVRRLFPRFGDYFADWLGTLGRVALVYIIHAMGVLSCGVWLYIGYQIYPPSNQLLTWIGLVLGSFLAAALTHQLLIRTFDLLLPGLAEMAESLDDY